MVIAPFRRYRSSIGSLPHLRWRCTRGRPRWDARRLAAAKRIAADLLRCRRSRRYLVFSTASMTRRPRDHRIASWVGVLAASSARAGRTARRPDRALRLHIASTAHAHRLRCRVRATTSCDPPTLVLRRNWHTHEGCIDIAVDEPPHVWPTRCADTSASRRPVVGSTLRARRERPHLVARRTTGRSGYSMPAMLFVVALPDSNRGASARARAQRWTVAVGRRDRRDLYTYRRDGRRRELACATATTARSSRRCFDPPISSLAMGLSVRGRAADADRSCCFGRSSTRRSRAIVVAERGTNRIGVHETVDLALRAALEQLMLPFASWSLLVGSAACSVGARLPGWSRRRDASPSRAATSLAPPMF